MRTWPMALVIAMRTVIVVLGMAIVVQSLIVVQARPQDLITGVHGMADLIRRAMPPDFSRFPDMLWPTLETVAIALFGTIAGVCLALPLAVLAAVNESRGVRVLWREPGERQWRREAFDSTGPLHVPGVRHRAELR